MEEAKLHLITNLQKKYFSEELNYLSHKIQLKKSSKLKFLTPFVDKDGILRVGGRLENAPISWDEKHPIILPKDHITDLIIRYTHLRNLHGGVQSTLFLLRKNFWPIKAKLSVKKIINSCIICIKQSAKVHSQLMGDLPSCRITPSRTFQHTGIDYAGPIEIRTGKGRGYKSIKGYFCIFVCMVTRAVHSEAVTDYSAKTVILTLIRFVSRRGLPSDIYSDNGTNFRGADKELKEAWRNVTNEKSVQNHVLDKGIRWHFNPPHAPHFGGLWEAGVKSVKSHFKRVIGKQTLTFEELITLLCQVEACLNSRPIAALSNKADDFNYLTPGHFLIGAPLLSIPHTSETSPNKDRFVRWNLVQRMMEDFWKRWSIEYPQGLQKHYKWIKITKNIQKNDLVLIQDPENLKMKWTMGRVSEVHPGKDNLVRVVSVKTSKGTYRRPISQICLLPLQQEKT